MATSEETDNLEGMEIVHMEPEEESAAAEAAEAAEAAKAAKAAEAEAEADTKSVAVQTDEVIIEKTYPDFTMEMKIALYKEVESYLMNHAFNVSTVRKLISADVPYRSIDILDVNGYSALHYIANNENEIGLKQSMELIDKLMWLGADIERETNDSDRYTPLMLAFNKTSRDIINYLVDEYNANLNVAKKPHLIIECCLHDTKLFEHVVNNKKFSLACATQINANIGHVIASKNLSKYMIILLKACEDREDANTVWILAQAMSYILEKSSKNIPKYSELIDVILNSKFAKDVVNYAFNKPEEKSANKLFHICLRKGRYDIAMRFIELGVDIEWVSNDGMTAHKVFMEMEGRKYCFEDKKPFGWRTSSKRSPPPELKALESRLRIPHTDGVFTKKDAITENLLMSIGDKESIVRKRLISKEG